VLRLSGYAVIEAENGEDAVSVFMENRDRIALVILDVVMPKRNRKEVYEEIKTLRPETGVLFLSGYPENLIDDYEIPEEDLHFISKGVSPDEILQKIREVLDARGNE